MPHLSSITYNADNEMCNANLGGGGTAYYQYSGGQRARKAIASTSNVEQRIYLGNYEIYRKFVGGSLTFERITVHVNDDTGRIAMLEIRTVGTDPSPASVARYIYSNHLSTATLELDGSANIISYEEYHPYGTTSFQSNDINKAVAKRYRYTNKERDDETGLYYIGARYYAPWLTRWCAADPINSEWYNYTHGVPKRNLERQFVELTASNYEYCFASPVRFTDPTGEQVKPYVSPDVDSNVTFFGTKLSGGPRMGYIVNTIESLSSGQMLDALKIARDQVTARRGIQNAYYDVGHSGAFLNPLANSYAQSHHLSAQQAKDFTSTLTGYYAGLVDVVKWNSNQFDKLNRSVINNEHLSAYDRVKISVGSMIESHQSLWSFMGSSLTTVQFIAGSSVHLGPAGKGPRGPMINSDNQQMIVTFGMSRDLNSFSDIANNPGELWGKSADEVQSILGEGWTKGNYGKTGTGWKFSKDDKIVFFHQGGRHEGDYYGFSSGETGKVKIVDPATYKALPGDKAKIIIKN